MHQVKGWNEWPSPAVRRVVYRGLRVLNAINAIAVAALNETTYSKEEATFNNCSAHNFAFWVLASYTFFDWVYCWFILNKSFLNS